MCGVDEAGRGPLAGPVVTAACIVPPDVQLPDALNDSKQMSEAERELAYEQICPQTRLTMASPLSRSSIVTHGRIDEINILQATMEGMRQSVEALHCEC